MDNGRYLPCMDPSPNNTIRGDDSSSSACILDFDEAKPPVLNNVHDQFANGIVRVSIDSIGEVL